MEPLNNGHVGDERFVHCSEVVPSSEVEMYIQVGDKQFVHCGEVVHSSECPLSHRFHCIKFGTPLKRDIVLMAPMCPLFRGFTVCQYILWEE